MAEDFCIDVEDLVPASVIVAKELAVKHLYTPLPPDLPPLQKDILILIAAYNGDVDRYSRLRRSGIFIDKEVFCTIRGIYHNTFFAKWWSGQVHSNKKEYSFRALSEIIPAINARAIMNNDLSRITSATPWQHIPYCIWYPSVPHHNTLKLLVARRPDMAHQVARACIVSDCEPLYDELNPSPDKALLAEAKVSPNGHYLKALKDQISTDQLTGKEVVPDHGSSANGWKLYSRDSAFELNSIFLMKTVDTDRIGIGFDWLYNGSFRADISEVELHVSALASGQVAGDQVPRAHENLTAFAASVNEVLSTKGTLDLELGYREEAAQIAR